MKAIGLAITREEGGIGDFLGVKIEVRGDGTIKLSQPHLIDEILSDLGLTGDSVKGKATPMASSRILSRHLDSDDFDEEKFGFKYASVIGKLNYLEKCTRMDISYASHQCARFTHCPKVEHGRALKWLGRYLHATRKEGLILRPNGDSFDCYVDADWMGNWDKNIAHWDMDTARSRTGYVIAYGGCPFVWSSGLQSMCATSSTEAEIIALSSATREVLFLMQLLKEIKAHGLIDTDCHPKIHCKVYEDNAGAIEIATTHKVRPRTKHLNVLMQQARYFVSVTKEISVLPIHTEDQLADLLTKPVDEATMLRLRPRLLGF